MAKLLHAEVAAAVDAAGAGTFYTDYLTGLIHSIVLYRTDYAATMDVAISLEETLQVVLSITNQPAVFAQWFPRVIAHNLVGAQAQQDATPNYRRVMIPVVGERVKIELSQAGVSTSGTWHVFYLDGSGELERPAGL